MSIFFGLIQLVLMVIAIGLPIVLIIFIVRSMNDSYNLRVEQNETLEKIYDELKKLNSK